MEKSQYEAIIADQQVLIRTLWAALEDVAEHWKDFGSQEAERLKQMLAGTKRDAVQISVCDCGHLMADHDEKGCQYLGCKRICGTI